MSDRLELEDLTIDLSGVTACSLADDTYYIDVKTDGDGTSCVCKDSNQDYLVTGTGTDKGDKYEVSNLYQSIAKIVASDPRSGHSLHSPNVVLPEKGRQLLYYPK